MAGSGFMSHAQSSLKNNRRNKKRLFDTLERYVKTSKDPVIVDIKATPHQLQQIRHKIRKEQKHRFKRNVFYTVLLAIILFILFKFAPV